MLALGVRLDQHVVAVPDAWVSGLWQQLSEAAYQLVRSDGAPLLDVPHQQVGMQLVGAG